MPSITVSDGEVEVLHQATLRVLSDTGIVLTHPEARELLLDAGASSDAERVFLPPDLVERQVARCPSAVVLRGRSQEPCVLGSGELHWHNLGGARDVFDPSTGQRRKATVQDVQDAARLLDALENATTITPFFTPQDVPGPLMSLAMYRYSLPETTKPLHGPGVQNAQEVRYAAEMASVIGPQSQVLALGVSPISPLTFPDDITAAMMEIARRGIPFDPLPCPTAGTTAPFSLAGALVQQNAEVLASVVLAQLITPGLPVVYHGRLAMMEPRTAGTVWSGVELGLASAVTVQIGHHYGLPVNVYGFSTNAHVIDVQSGYERALNAVIPALAGADELSGIGEMAAGVMSSYAQIVCDDEIAGSVRRLLECLAVDDGRMAVDVIAEAMMGDRSFIATEHTLEYLRSGEMFVTDLAERRPWNVWEEEGRGTMSDRAQAKAQAILVEHEVPPLTQEQERALDEILDRARQTLVN